MCSDIFSQYAYNISPPAKFSCKILVFPDYSTWPTVCAHTHNLVTYCVLALTNATTKK